MSGGENLRIKPCEKPDEGEANLQVEMHTRKSYRIVKFDPKGTRESRATRVLAKAMERVKNLDSNTEEPSGVKGLACRDSCVWN